MLIFLTIMVLQLSCLVLPGPDFFVTVSNSVRHGHKYGIITALGIASGISLNTLIVYWFGSFLLYQQPLLFKTLIFIGACYLGYLAFSLFKNVFTKQELNPNAKIHINNLKNTASKPSAWKFFRSGAYTNLANAKAIIFFSSMLSLIAKADTLDKLAVWIGIILSTAIWFSIVAIFFGNNLLRERFFRNIKKIEFVSALFITAFTIIILIELF